MVKRKRSKKAVRKQAKKARRQARKNKLCRISKSRSPKIGPNTEHDICSERLTAFGGLLALVKFLDLIKFKDVFRDIYVSPPRKTMLGCYRMVLGLLIMLFVGFQRIGHIKYLRQDSMITGILEQFKLSCSVCRYMFYESLSYRTKAACIASCRQ